MVTYENTNYDEITDEILQLALEAKKLADKVNHLTQLKDYLF